jgi:hypothetical protein
VRTLGDVSDDGWLVRGSTSAEEVRGYYDLFIDVGARDGKDARR